jgi:hypothetical protein
MDVQPQLAPLEFFKFGDQRANMDVPPPHLFRFDDGGHPANMVVQPPLPPSEFNRFGDHLTNMDVPRALPPSINFIRFGDQLANMVVPHHISSDLVIVISL